MEYLIHGRRIVVSTTSAGTMAMDVKSGVRAISAKEAGDVLARIVAYRADQLNGTPDKRVYTRVVDSTDDEEVKPQHGRKAKKVRAKKQARRSGWDDIHGELRG